MLINSVSDLDKALDTGGFAWPGGYPLYFITDDGAALAFTTVKNERETIAQSINDYLTDGLSDGWRVVAVDINYEDTELYCDHTNEKIESAYGDDS